MNNKQMKEKDIRSIREIMYDLNVDYTRHGMKDERLHIRYISRICWSGSNFLRVILPYPPLHIRLK